MSPQASTVPPHSREQWYNLWLKPFSSNMLWYGRSDEDQLCMVFVSMDGRTGVTMPHTEDKPSRGHMERHSPRYSRCLLHLRRVYLCCFTFRGSAVFSRMIYSLSRLTSVRWWFFAQPLEEFFLWKSRFPLVFLPKNSIDYHYWCTSKSGHVQYITL